MSTAAPTREPIHILLVEADPNDVRTIWNLLHETSRFQYHLEAVTGLHDAFLRLKQSDIDVVLLDLSLISIDAEMQAVREFRLVSPNTALLVLTELENEQAGLQALEAGAQDYLLKEEVGTRALVRALHYAVERNRADLARYAEAERNQAAMASLLDYAMITLDRHGVITDWSPGAEKIFDYAFADILGESFTRLFTPDDQAAGVPEQELTDARTRGVAEDERWMMRSNGERFFASGTVRPLRDPAGLITGYIKLLRDITQRAEAEEALRRSEERWRRMLDTEAVGVLVFDDSGTVIHASDAFLTMTGYTLDQLERRELTWQRMTPPEWIAESEAQMVQLAETGRVGPYQKEYFLADGSRRWMLFAGRALGDGTIVEFCVDLTDRVQMEQALRISEAKYRTLFNSIDQGFCLIEVIFDEDGQPVDYRFVDVNDAFERQTGLTNARGRHVRELVPGLEQYWLELCSQVARTGESVWLENRVAELNRYYEVYAFRSGKPEDHVIAVLFNDITQRRLDAAAEIDRRRLAETLSETATRLSSTVKLEEVLQGTLELAQRIVPFDAGYVVLFSEGALVGLESSGLSPSDATRLRRWHQSPDLPGASLYRATTIGQHPYLADPGHFPPLRTIFASCLVAPLAVQRDVTGYLVLLGRAEDAFAEADLVKAESFAYPVRAAINNARRFLQGQELAALHERQQFARDLHDAVTQTLFTASVMLDTLPRLRESHPDKVPELMRDVNQMVKSALAELRTLLLELRPTHIQSTPFPQLLQQLTAAVQGRKRMEIALDFQGEPALLPEVQVVVYRIAQEALNNISKHAGAGQLWITGRGENGHIELHIRDDGVGFPADKPSAGMGLAMMRERAAEIGARLDVRSRESEGTEIVVIWPAPPAPDEPAR